jgi:hypothetical protein
MHPDQNGRAGRKSYLVWYQKFSRVTPGTRLPKVNLVGISPPRIKEDIANKPPKNAFNIGYDFELIIKQIKHDKETIFIFQLI